MVDDKGKFTRAVAGKYKVIFKFIENHPKISKNGSCSAIWIIGENSKLLFCIILFSGL